MGFKVKSFFIILLLFSNILWAHEKCLTSHSFNKLNIEFAEFFEIWQRKKQLILINKMPWDGKKAIFYGKGIKKINCSFSLSLLSEGPQINIASNSTTHIAFLSLIRAINLVKGFSGSHYVSNPFFIEREQVGPIVELGIPPKVERLLKNKINYFFSFSTLGPDAEGFSEFSKVGVDPIYISEFREKGPLARAEWIRFIGHIIGKGKEADQKFLAVKNRYLFLKSLVTQEIKNKPAVMIGSPYMGRWHIPGAQSDFAHIVRAAGGKYIGNNKQSNKTQTLPFEKVVSLIKKTDIWLTHNKWKSMKDLREGEPRLKKIINFNKIKIYNNNRLMTSDQANDFWESSGVRPDLLLADMIHMIHPKLKTGNQLRWYQIIK